jgi:hypothetical protein
MMVLAAALLGNMGACAYGTARVMTSVTGGEAVVVVNRKVLAPSRGSALGVARAVPLLHDDAGEGQS